MTIRIDHYIWNAEKTKILFHNNIKIDESELIEIMQQRYEDEQLPMPMHLSKDDVISEFSIDGITT